MTDEERQKLCAQLRYMHNEWYCDHCDLEPCEIAADEIEWLEKEVARLKDENGVIREQCQNMLDMMVR